MTACWLSTVLLLGVVVGCSHGRLLRLPSMSSLYSTRMVAGNNALKRSTSGLRRGDYAPPVPVFMMMPLDTVLANGTLSDEAMDCLPAVRDVGAEGIMLDVWWGLCERSPGNYSFAPYVEILNRCRDLGIKVQFVMSFHGCGGNIGDSVNIPIPEWVLDLEDTVPELFYRDQNGDPSREYVSLSCDDLGVFPSASASESRTAVQLYHDFMVACQQACTEHITNGTLAEIQVGCGPCGELRYPSYPMAPREHTPEGWQWPGIGEFQCYDAGMLSDMTSVLKRDAPPAGAGQYNDAPDDTPFFAAPAVAPFTPLSALSRCLGKDEVETWESPSGSVFLAWYSGCLIDHGRRVLRKARDAFGPDMRLAAKVSGIHWLRGHPSRAAEATAGYVGDYLGNICEMLAETNTVLDFTCFEMRDALQSSFAYSRPQGLVLAAAAASVEKGVGFAGENALFCWESEAAVETIEEQSELAVAGGAEMVGLTALRLTPWLVKKGSSQRRRLERFIANMGNLASRGSSRGRVERAMIWMERAWGAWTAKNF